MSKENHKIIFVVFIILLASAMFGSGGDKINNNVVDNQQNKEYDLNKIDSKDKSSDSKSSENKESKPTNKNKESDDNYNGEFNYISNKNVSEINTSVNKSIKETVESVASSLPKNTSERREKIELIASEICDLETSNFVEEGVKKGDSIYRDTYQAKHTASVLNDYMNAGLNIKLIEKHMKGLRKTTSKADKYAPVIGSYNRLNNSSCSIVSGEKGAYKDFYLASTFFATDMAMLQYGVGYKLSFAGTRYAANRIGVTKMINICGKSCTSFLMSNGHHSIRGSLGVSIDYIQNKAIESKILNKDYIDYDIINESIGSTKNMTDNLEECINKSESENSKNQDEDTGIFNNVKSEFEDKKEYIENNTDCVGK